MLAVRNQVMNQLLLKFGLFCDLNVNISSVRYLVDYQWRDGVTISVSFNHNIFVLQGHLHD